MKVYHVKNWQERYETHETRKLKSLGWVATPNKHDGLGYRTMAAEKDSIGLFTAWNLIIQVASKSEPKDRRGYLERDGLPITPAQFELITGFPAKIFERGLSFFSSPCINWLESTICETSPGMPGENPGTPGNDPAKTPLNGREGNGKKGMELPPLPEEVDTPEMREAWNTWLVYRAKKKKPVTDDGATESFREFKEWGVAKSIVSLRKAIKQGWQGNFEPDEKDMRGISQAVTKAAADKLAESTLNFGPAQ